MQLTYRGSQYSHSRIYHNSSTVSSKIIGTYRGGTLISSPHAGAPLYTLNLVCRGMSYQACAKVC